MAKSKRTTATAKRKKTTRQSTGSTGADNNQALLQDTNITAKNTEEVLPSAQDEVAVIKNSRKMPSAWSILKKSFSILKHDWKLFAGIAVIYAVLNLLVVGGVVSTTDATTLKEVARDEYPGAVGTLSTGFAIFALLIYQTGNSVSDVIGAYQLFFTIIVSLASIWALRAVLAKEGRVRIRDAFYNGMYPLVPVALLLVLIVLQLLPFLVGGGIFTTVVSSGLASTPIEQILWSLPLILGTVLTSYWITASVVALYVVTLPDMTPMKALRSAKRLVRFRRLSVLRKLLFLPLALLVIGAVVLLPVIFIFMPAAPWVFFGLTMASLIVIHTYCYNLYRELLA